MALEHAIRDHQTWIGYLQPEGLVVSPAALVDSQIYLDRDITDRQREFAGFIEEVDTGDRDIIAIPRLRRLLLEFLGWPEDLVHGVAPQKPLPETLTIALPELNETLAPSLALADVGPDDAPPNWLMLVKELPLAADMDARETGREASWSASATQKFERLLRETGIPIGLLSNGTHFRLLYAPRGENSGSLTFPVKAMTEVAGRPIFSAFWMLLARERLISGPAEARLPALLTRSREYQATVSKELAGQVLDALYELVRGLQAADAHTKGELLREVLKEHPDEIYRGLLTVLLRLVFLLYAEDRALLPTSELYVENYSVHGLFTRLRTDAQRYQDTMDQRYGAWARLVALFRAVYSGSRHPKLRMPPRRGFLFDPDRFPFLEGRRPGEEPRIPLIADGVLYRVLDKLLILGGERLSYRTLDVEQIGSVYETMMGFRLEQTSGRTIAVKAGKSGGAPVALDLDALLKMKASDRAKHLAENADLKLSGKASEGLGEARTLEELLSALDRRIARNATPHVLPSGAMILQPTDERRRSGSHYTPRSLTEPIVRTTLRPVLERLGPSPKPEQILDLKVCDIAVGSGAFLVESCRQLGDALLHAWHVHGNMPYIPPDEDEVLHARRVVAQRCLYGVDKNPMAVDLTKLSLWLATLAKDHPFTFLDHSVRAGDSLVGLTAKQIADFHWLPTPARVFGQEFLEQRIATATTQRQLILTLEDDLSGPELKLQKLRLADDALNLVREAGDLVIAAFFAGENAKERLRRREEYLTQYTRFYREFLPELNPGPVVNALRGGARPLTPFHWEIEFPEVLAGGRGGFDAIVGNPPFAGKNTLSKSNRGGYIDWLKELHSDSLGSADLVSHFFRRAFKSLNPLGCSGLIATNTIGQGDTRETGLCWICQHGGIIYAAQRRLRWPGSAAVVVSVVWITRNKGLAGPYRLDGRDVQQITAYLFHLGRHEKASLLRQNSGMSFKGCELGSLGFVLASQSEEALRYRDVCHPQNRTEVLLKPYIGGEDLNSSPQFDSGRLVLDVDGLSHVELQSVPGLLGLLDSRVRVDLLERKLISLSESEWWHFRRPSREFRKHVSQHSRILAISEVATHFSFGFLQTSVIPSHKIKLVAFTSYSGFGVLQSRPHELWARLQSSTMKDDLNYSPTDCFETYPLPNAWQMDSRLETAGFAYYNFRAECMTRNRQGFTDIYNRFHDPNETDPDILRLRELHDAMDRAVLDAYGWTNIRPTCEFLLDYEDEEDEETSSKRKKPWRYRWPDEIRDEVLAKLLALNAERAEEERLAGEAAAKETKKGTKKSRGKGAANSGNGELFG